jgi:ParB-like chromosome segregation protein Spo0J
MRKTTKKAPTAPDMQIEMVAIDSLHPPTRNVRVHPEKQIKELARAINKFGQTRPVVIDVESTVLAGNGLVEAYKLLGRTEVAVYRKTGLSAADKTKLMLSDNRIYSLGLDDHEAILEAIGGLDRDFDIPGFDTDILNSLVLDDANVTASALGSMAYCRRRP